jgi:hypothetical protein
MPQRGYSPNEYTPNTVDLEVNKPGMEYRIDKRYSKYLDDATLRLIQKSGFDLAYSIRAAIKDQIYEWRPLSPDYARYKEINDLDERILIATEEYVNSIRAWKTPTGVEVGLPPEVDHSTNGVPLRLLARWLEYGTKNYDGNWKMWPRPHWRPEILRWKNNVLPDLKKELKSRIMANMSMEMRKRVKKIMLTVNK